MPTTPSETSKDSLYPRWLRRLFVATSVLTLVFFLSALIYALLTKGAQADSLPGPAYGRLVSAAIVSFGATVFLGIVATIIEGSVYSGFARGKVTRKKNPVHFWLIMAMVFALVVAIITFGVWKLVAPSAS